MKLRFGAVAFLVLAQCAWAQSNVTMFGLIDAGVTYVSNGGGGKNVKFDDGIFTPNLFGFRGVEDLGGGYRATFALVNQFSMANGGIVGSGIFGRNAYVGIESDRLGNVTLGNQYDFMVDSLFAKGNAISMDVTGLYGFRNGPFQRLALPDNPTGAFDWDRTPGSKPVANSVKDTSPAIAGLSGGAMYAFGGVAGSVGADNTVSAGLNYEMGPFGIGAAYTNEKYGPAAGVPSTSVRNWGVGMHYTLGALTAKALVTTVHNSFNGAGVWMAEAGGVWRLQPDIFGAKYMYMKGNEAVGNNHAHQVSAALQYLLTKRTLVYVSADYQRANDGASAQINGGLMPTVRRVPQIKLRSGLAYTRCFDCAVDASSSTEGAQTHAARQLSRAA